MGIYLVILTIAIFILFLIAFIYFKIIYPQKRIYDELRAQGISGEKYIPLFGQLNQIRKNRKLNKQFIYEEELTAKHGHVFLFGFSNLTLLAIHESDLLADILSRNNASNYVKPARFLDACVPFIGSHNLLVSGDNAHERARRMINPSFHHINLKSMISIITDRTSKSIESMLSKEKNTKSVDLQFLFNQIALSIIVSSEFGADFETTANARDVICRVFGVMLEISDYRGAHMINQIPLLSWLPFWRKNELDPGKRRVTEFIHQIISDRRHGISSSMSNGADLLDLLLSAVDDEGKSFTDEEIQGEFLIFVIAVSEN